MGISDDFSDFGHSRRPFRPTRPVGPAGGPPCPTCGTRNTAVIDSRPTPLGQKRRRRCLEKDSCPRWNTIELNGEPDQFTKPELSTLDKSRIIRILETADALRSSLKIPKP